MVPRCTQALDKCKCVSWAQLQHKFDKIDTFIVFPCHLSYVRGGQRDVGPFSSPVNVATAYRTQWVLLPTHHNHVCPLAVLSSCTLEDVEWIWFHGLAKWSSCPISTQTWLAPLVYQSRSIHLLESWLRMIHGEEKSKVWTHLTFARCPQLDLSSE